MGVESKTATAIAEKARYDAAHPLMLDALNIDQQKAPRHLLARSSRDAVAGGRGAGADRAG